MGMNHRFGKYPYYDEVPKDLAANIDYRRQILIQAENSQSFRDDLWDMCSTDPLFYINTFCFIFEPRKASASGSDLLRKNAIRVMPWITYDFQDSALDKFFWWIGRKDICNFKSRDMGATWCCLAPFDWFFNFGENCKFKVMSRNQMLVDMTNETGSLFWKLDFLRNNCPPWLRCPVHRIKNSVHNQERENWIIGEATTDASTVGDRCIAVLFDEFSRMDNQEEIYTGARDVTDCRITNFTPWYGAHYAKLLADSPDSEELCRIDMGWEEHPIKGKGLYIAYPDGRIEIRDTKSPPPADYPFVKDGELRSIWFDRQEKRERNRSAIDLHLRRRWVGGNLAYFDHGALNWYEQNQVNMPWHTGEVFPDRPEDREFREDPNGRLNLWIHLDIHDHPTPRKYAIACDVALGTVDYSGRGASNSSATIWDRALGKMVGEFTVAGMDPKEFARYVLALAWLFQDSNGEPAYLKWEKNGPGGLFGNVIVQALYPRHLIFFKLSNPSAIDPDATDVPGWPPMNDARMELYGDFAIAIRNHKPEIYSSHVIRECRDYIGDETGQPRHQATIKTKDPTLARANHGDRATSAAIGWSCCFRTKALEREQGDEPDEFVQARRMLTLGGRREQRERARKARMWPRR